MLVSSIARFNTMNTMNNAAFSSMQASNSMTNSVSHANTFGGEHDLSMLNSMDKKYSMDLLTNRLLYKITHLQEKLAAKHQDNESKKSFSILA